MIDVQESTTTDVLMRTAQLFMSNEHSEISPLLLFPQPDGVDILDLSETDREIVPILIKQVVEENSNNRYFGLFAGFKLNTKDVEKDILNRFKSLKKTKFDEKKFNKWLDYAAKKVSEPPSKSKHSTSVLIACSFDKQKGTDILMCEYKIHGKGKRTKFTFGKVQDFSAEGEIYTHFNIWHPQQISIKGAS
jgi:hypothetical protein